MERIKRFYTGLLLMIMMTLISMAQGTARLQVIHNAADPGASEVDVYIDGELLLDNFAFRTATPFIDIPTGVTVNIGIAAGTSTGVDDTLRNFAVMFEDQGTYVAIANGVLDPNGFEANPDGISTAFTLFLRDMAREAGQNGMNNVDFFVLHGSTDAPTVDVIARDVATLVNNAPYGGVTDYVNVPAASYILDVTPGDDNNTIVASFVADLSGLGGGSAAVFASGFLSPENDQNGAAFGIFAALANGTVVEFPGYEPTARLQVIHNAADPAASEVDVYINGALTLDDFAFRTATPFIDIPAGVTVNIGIAPGTSSSVDDTLRNFAVMFEDQGTYVAIANGVLDPNGFEANPDGISTAFTLFLRDMAREAGANGMDNVDFFVVHGSTDAPTVDVIARDVATLVDDAPYGGVTDYINVPAASYILDVTPGNDNSTIVGSFVADLSGLGGGSAAVFASGFLTPENDQDGASFGIFAALANGTVVEFPAEGTLDVEKDNIAIPAEFDLKQNYPNPFNPTTTISFDVPENGKVTLQIFNITGQIIATLVNKNLSAGSYKLVFDAAQIPSGAYFYQIRYNNNVVTKKMVLLK